MPFWQQLYTITCFHVYNTKAGGTVTGQQWLYTYPLRRKQLQIFTINHILVTETQKGTPSHQFQTYLETPNCDSHKQWYFP